MSLDALADLHIMHRSADTQSQRIGPPRYSRNMNDAMRLVEQLRRDGYYINISNQGKLYSVGFFDETGNGSVSVDRFLATAITKAALTVKNVNLENERKERFTRQ